MGPGTMAGHGGGPAYGGHRFGPGENKGRGRDAGRMLGRMARVLGLSEDQRAKVRRIMEDTRRKNWDVLGQIRSARFDLREIMRADKIDPDAAVEQKRKVDDLRRQIMRARLEARNQVLALLTPEQREKERAFGPRRWSRHGRG
jgi:Spy/CpxP family protein refolding chaperone